VSARLSPDGMYYWDGSQWLSTLSPDGGHRWNGTAWVPVQRTAFVPPVYSNERAPARVATSWTRPLQYAVAGWYALSGLYALSLPFWMGGIMSQAMNQSIHRQEALNPAASPLPASFYDSMTSIATGVLWFAAVIGAAICLVAIVGSLMRWTWLYYVVLVLLGLGTLSLPLNLVSAITGSSVTASSGFAMPDWLYFVSVAMSVPGAALFVWMLIAIVRRGPWGMTRPVS
jgi:hypothetical protein